MYSCLPWPEVASVRPPGFLPCCVLPSVPLMHLMPFTCPTLFLSVSYDMICYYFGVFPFLLLSLFSLSFFSNCRGCFARMHINMAGWLVDLFRHTLPAGEHVCIHVLRVIYTWLLVSFYLRTTRSDACFLCFRSAVWLAFTSLHPPCWRFYVTHYVRTIFLASFLYFCHFLFLLC